MKKIYKIQHLIELNSFPKFLTGKNSDYLEKIFIDGDYDKIVGGENLISMFKKFCKDLDKVLYEKEMDFSSDIEREDIIEILRKIDYYPVFLAIVFEEIRQGTYIDRKNKTIIVLAYSLEELFVKISLL